MTLRGNPQKIKDVARRLRELPTTVAQDVAGKVAPDITARAKASYSAGETVYSDARPAGEHGALTLVKSGATLASLAFVAIGTRIRCQLGTRWAKYLIGKYRILPMGRMPYQWSERIGAVVKDTIDRTLGVS